MGLKDLFRKKHTPFEELWKQVEGIPEGIKKQIYDDLSESTKKGLEKHFPKEIEEKVNIAIEKINNGSVDKIDTLLGKEDMDKRKRIKIIGEVLTLGLIILVFLIINLKIDMAHKQRLSFVSDGPQYCYGIDSLKREGNNLSLQGWFLEMKSIKKVKQEVNPEDAELLLALVPVEEAVVGEETGNAVFFNMSSIHEDRQDVNDYFSCEFDYSRCGFSATIDCDDLDLLSKTYRLAVKPNSSNKKAVLVNVYISDEGLSYTDPTHSPRLDTLGTDIDEIVKKGVMLVSRPDYGIYVYQFLDKLYWIADDNFVFCDDGKTIIQYHIDTTQIEKLPRDRLDNHWYWSSIGDAFENHEITGQINCGKYRVSVRNIPEDYSAACISTGYKNEALEYVWTSSFKPVYTMLM